MRIWRPRSTSKSSLPSLGTGPRAGEDGRKDLLSTLPTELLLAIVEALGQHQPNRLSPIRQLSLVNRRLNSVTNHRIFRSFSLSAHRKRNGLPQTRTAEIQRAVQDRCATVLRNHQRAACIERLELTLYSSASSDIISRMRDCLLLMPNLRALRITFQRGDDLSPRLLKDFSSMLNNTALLPFHLLEFDCEAQLLLISPGISPFLSRQSSIQRLFVGRLKTETFWIEPMHPLYSNSAEGSLLLLLPKLVHFRGPSSLSRSILAGRSAPLQSIHLLAQHTDRDLEMGIATPAETRPPPSTILGRVDSFALWSDGSLDLLDVDARLARLLPSSYAIDPHSIRSLKVGCIGANFNIRTSLPEFPVHMLGDFTSLISLEWTTSGGLGGAMTAFRNERRATLLEFLQKTEGFCSSLRRIVFTSREERILELLRTTEEKDRHLPSDQDQDEAAPSQLAMQFRVLERGQTAMNTATALDPSTIRGMTTLDLPSGSVWTVQSRTNAPIAFYPAAPTTDG